MKVLLVGVRGHGGEGVYSDLLRDRPPAGVQVSATFDFHRSCEWGRCDALSEVLLNRLVHPRLAFDMGFRVLRIDPSVDLVHVHTHPTLLRGLDRRPVVFSASSSHYHYLRDYERWPDQLIHKRYARARGLYSRLDVFEALLHPDRVTLAYTFSEWARTIYLELGVPSWKVRVLPPGFDVRRARRDDTGDSRQTPTFLFMGRQPQRKGGPAVLDAFARLRETLTSARLLYVTDEHPPQPGPGVEIYPLVPPERTAELYNRADVFVNPTKAEGFGFTNVEAQGYGLPVISSHLGAIPEVVADGRTGILVDPDDGEALLAAMLRLGRDASLRREMGLAALERFEDRFSLERFHSRLRAIYDEARDLA